MHRISSTEKKKKKDITQKYWENLSVQFLNLFQLDFILRSEDGGPE